MRNPYSSDKIWFLGRSYKEYFSMFNLSFDLLKEEKVLDCAAGASSFTAIASKKGIKSTATDLLYCKDPATLQKIFKKDLSTLLKIHSGLEHKVNWGFFLNSEKMIKDRFNTFNNFINDYTKFKERYITAQLPYLPFNDNPFTLALSSHLLFLYDDRLNYQFHLDSIKEMLRVTSEVRIYPLISLRGDGKKSSFVNKIKKDIIPEGKIKILDVKYRFREGCNEMMCIKKME